jgi:excisionase family DNA binding protein
MAAGSKTYSIPEAAKQLGLSRSAAYAAAARGELPVPVLRIGSRLLVPRAALDRLLDGYVEKPLNDHAA